MLTERWVNLLEYICFVGLIFHVAEKGNGLGG